MCEADSGQLGYFLYLPSCIIHRHLLVAVHGVGSTAAAMARHFASIAERSGIAVMAPDFSTKRFRGYQRLEGMAGRDQSAVALDLAACEAAERLGLDRHSFDLFGFSGGAQFAHRYAMTRPERIRRLIVTAAGWYTECDLGKPFPCGMGGRTDHASLQAFLSLPITVAVGERDTERDSCFRKTDALDERQGLNRLERARFWADHLRQTAVSLDVDCNVSLTLLSRTKHRFREAVEQGGLAELVVEKIAMPIPAVFERSHAVATLGRSHGRCHSSNGQLKVGY
jgi:pimeloyl-ACP methyl ester carboxylesterase